MTAIEALMSRLIDYAGLFPPASLDLDTAMRNYMSYRQHEDSWMLDRFIIPAGRLGELVLAQEAEPYRFTVLIGSGETEDTVHVERFLEQCESTARIEAVETVLPSGLVGRSDREAVEEYLHRFGARVERVCPACDIYVEIPGGDDWAERAETVIHGLAQFARQRTGAGATGMKLRCGGMSAAAFPSIERVAFHLAACRNFGLPLKLTAGLHHPLPKNDLLTGATMYGFMNVYMAALLLLDGQIDCDRIDACLRENRPERFRIDTEGMTWSGHRIDGDTIARLRGEYLPGFGSCSFDDPRNDLRQLGWLT